MRPASQHSSCLLPPLPPLPQAGVPAPVAASPPRFFLFCLSVSLARSSLEHLMTSLFPLSKKAHTHTHGPCVTTLCVCVFFHSPQLTQSVNPPWGGNETADVQYNTYSQPPPTAQPTPNPNPNGACLPKGFTKAPFCSPSPPPFLLVASIVPPSPPTPPPPPPLG